MDCTNIPHTCPMINQVLDFLEYVHEINDTSEIVSQSLVFQAIMENIRTANNSLRCFGIEKVNEINQLEQEIKTLTSDNYDLNYELEQLKEKVSILESEIYH